MALLPGYTRRTAMPLPALHARWIAELLTRPLGEETRATCDACPMIRDDAEPRFRGETKCCTFLPELPNFSVGAILADDDPGLAHGRGAVAARIDNGVAVTPFGLGRSGPYRKLYAGANVFGRSGALRCPYHREDGGCGVWRHRESTCATWYCKHERGAMGAEVWAQVRKLLSLIERAVARWAALEQGVPAEALDALGERGPPPEDRDGLAFTTWDLDKRADPDFYRGIWGAWADREREFFAACGRRVHSLTAVEAVGIAGPLARLFAMDARRAQEALDEGAPELVQIRFLEERQRRGDGTVRVRGYSPYDELELPAALVDALPGLEGKSAGEALAELRRRGISADQALLRRLADYQVIG
jgi:hypothetical protein